MSEVITEKDLERAAAVEERVGYVSMAVAGVYAEDCEIDYDTGMVEASWEVPACNRGCCGYETRSVEFPLDLCVGTQEEVEQKIAEFKQKREREQEAKRKAEEARKKKEKEEEERRKQKREKETYERLKEKFG